jgi:hypothetical protein
VIGVRKPRGDTSRKGNLRTLRTPVPANCVNGPTGPGGSCFGLFRTSLVYTARLHASYFPMGVGRYACRKRSQLLYCPSPREESGAYKCAPMYSLARVSTETISSSASHYSRGPCEPDSCHSVQQSPPDGIAAFEFVSGTRGEIYARRWNSQKSSHGQQRRTGRS